MQSKAIKKSFFGCGCKPGSKTFMKQVYHFFKFDILYPIYYFIYSKVKLVIRMYEWAKFGKDNYDFDGIHLYQVMHYKLQRIQKALINGMAIQEKEDMDALANAITITENLGNKDYEEVYYNAHELMWEEYPPIKMETIKNEKDGKVTHYKWISNTRSGVITEDDKKQEREDLFKINELATNDRNKDLDKLNEILKKYLLRWWD